MASFFLVLTLWGCDAGPQPGVAAQSTSPVQVIGRVRGWDRSGDVAVEACGVGVLVDDDAAFGLATDASCELRVVWEREGARAVGPWHALKVRDGVARMVLPMPDLAALKLLTVSEQAERNAFLESARQQLEAGADAACDEPPPQSKPGA